MPLGRASLLVQLGKRAVEVAAWWVSELIPDTAGVCVWEREWVRAYTALCRSLGKQSGYPLVLSVPPSHYFLDELKDECHRSVWGCNMGITFPFLLLDALLARCAPFCHFLRSFRVGASKESEPALFWLDKDRIGLWALARLRWHLMPWDPLKPSGALLPGRQWDWTTSVTSSQEALCSGCSVASLSCVLTARLATSV